jgi:hypothetical protein
VPPPPTQQGVPAGVADAFGKTLGAALDRAGRGAAALAAAVTASTQAGQALAAGLARTQGVTQQFAASLTAAAQAERETTQAADALAAAMTRSREAQAAVTQLVTGGNAALKAHADEQRRIAEAARNVVSPGEALRGVLAKVSNAALTSSLNFAVLDRVIGAVQGAVGRFVQLASPGEFNRFQLAVDDLQASIGRALIPVLEQATRFVRAVGNAFFGLSSEGQKTVQALAAGTIAMAAFAAAVAVVQAVVTGGIGPILTLVVGSLAGVAAVSSDLQPLLDGLSGALSGVMEGVGQMIAALAPAALSLVGALRPFGDLLGVLTRTVVAGATAAAPAVAALGEILPAVVANAMAPLQLLAEAVGGQLVASLGMLGQVAQTVGPYLAVAARLVGDFVQFVVRQVRGLFGLVGIALPQMPQGTPQDSTGAAARSVSTGDPLDVLRRARESAFSMGTAANKPEERTASSTEAMNAKVEELLAAFRAFPDKLWAKLTEIPADLAEAVASATGRTVSGAVASAAPSSGTAAGVGLALVSPGAALAAEGWKRLRQLYD